MAGLEVVPTNPRLHYDLGVFQYEKQQTDEVRDAKHSKHVIIKLNSCTHFQAELSYARAIQLEPLHHDAVMNRGAILQLKEGRVDEAVHAFELSLPYPDPIMGSRSRDFS